MKIFLIRTLGYLIALKQITSDDIKNHIYLEIRELYDKGKISKDDIEIIEQSAYSFYCGYMSAHDTANPEIKTYDGNYSVGFVNGWNAYVSSLVDDNKITKLKHFIWNENTLMKKPTNG